jgi:hypothetical protein
MVAVAEWTIATVCGTVDCVMRNPGVRIPSVTRNEKLEKLIFLKTICKLSLAEWQTWLFSKAKGENLRLNYS